MVHGFKTGALQLEALAGVVGLAELVDFPAEGAEGAEFGAARGVGAAVPAGYGGEVVHGKELREVLRPLGGEIGVGGRDGSDGRDGRGGGGGFGRGGAGLGEHFAAELPGGEAVGAPFGEVHLADGARAEFGNEDGVDGGPGVKPGQEGGGGFVVSEAAIEFVAEGLGEAGDFAGTHILKAKG